LADPAGTAGEWYLNNCEVYSYFYGQYINANGIEWSNPDSEAYYYSSWVCASDSSWRIYFPQNCTWVKGTFNAAGDMELTPPNQPPTVVPTSSWVQPSNIPSSVVPVPVTALPTTIVTVYFPISSVPATIVSTLPPSVVASNPTIVEYLPSTQVANLPTTVL
jgi:hypothetical protein